MAGDIRDTLAVVGAALALVGVLMIAPWAARPRPPVPGVLWRVAGVGFLPFFAGIFMLLAATTMEAL